MPQAQQFIEKLAKDHPQNLRYYEANWAFTNHIKSITQKTRTLMWHKGLGFVWFNINIYNSSMSGSHQTIGIIMWKGLVFRVKSSMEMAIGEKQRLLRWNLVLKYKTQSGKNCHSIRSNKPLITFLSFLFSPPSKFINAIKW